MKYGAGSSCASSACPRCSSACRAVNRTSLEAVGLEAAGCLAWERVPPPSTKNQNNRKMTGARNTFMGNRECTGPSPEEQFAEGPGPDAELEATPRRAGKERNKC